LNQAAAFPRQVPQTKQFAETSILGRTGRAPAERPEKNLKNRSGTTESHALTQRLLSNIFLQALKSGILMTPATQSRKAWVGLVRLARHAGKKHAMTAMIVNPTNATAKARGSRGLT
jgi:hypothetical protein